MDLVKSKIKRLYPDADFSSVSSGDLIVFEQLIQEGLTKSKFNDKIADVKIDNKGLNFDEIKEPCLELDVKIHDKNNKIKNIELICYAFDVKIKNLKNDDLNEILLNAWNKFMISKFKRDYCDGLSNYILRQRVIIGESVAQIASNKLREVIIAKYSIEKEETNQP